MVIGIKTVGIIAEYNPFHSGHAYHIRKTKEQTGADYIVAVMSGDFVQRGEPAICDKYMRTQMALRDGADIVIELPAVYATASAEYFASAGVKLLEQLQVIDGISFGSEEASLEELQKLAELFLQEPEEYRRVFSECLKQGYNFPKARSLAVADYLRENRGQDGDDQEEKTRLLEILQKPNHILAIEYLKALKNWKSDMRPVAIKRQGQGYHSKELSGTFASASAIRALLNKEENGFVQTSVISSEDTTNTAGTGDNAERAMGIKDQLYAYMKEESADCLMDYHSKKQSVTWEDLMPYLEYDMLMKSKVLGKYFGMDLELARRLNRVHQPGMPFEDLMDELHSKKMTDTAIQRALLHVVLQMKEVPYLYDAKDIPVPYARVLGFRKTATPLLKKMREESRIPILQKPSEGKTIFQKDVVANYEERLVAEQIYGLDIRSAELYEQVSARKSGRMPVSEYQREQIIVTVHSQT